LRTDIRRRKIGFVFQRFNLFPTLTAEGNLRLAERIHGNGGEDPERRREVLRLLGLQDKLHHKPLELSGGEQQRVSLARAFSNAPQILFADEPTGNLNSRQGEEIMELFKKLNAEGATIIQVTHSEKNASYGNRIIQLRDGWIV